MIFEWWVDFSFLSAWSSCSSARSPDSHPGCFVSAGVSQFEAFGVESILRRAWHCTVATLHEYSTRAELGKAFRLSRRLEAGADVVLCNDAVARGLDLKAVSYVINLDIPKNLTSYLHRAGR